MSARLLINQLPGFAIMLSQLYIAKGDGIAQTV